MRSLTSGLSASFLALTLFSAALAAPRPTLRPYIRSMQLSALNNESTLESAEAVIRAANDIRNERSVAMFPDDGSHVTLALVVRTFLLTLGTRLPHQVPIVLRDVKVLRPNGTGIQTVHFNYKDVLNGDAKPFYLRSGDTVVVP